MKPLVWKTAQPRIDERASGFLILLLVLLVLHVLKPAPDGPSSAVLPCGGPLYVQVEGEVKYPGVYPFCTEPRVEDVIRRAGMGKGCTSFDFRGPATLAAGQKVVVLRDGSKCHVYAGEMGAYHKCSLSIPLSVNRESQEGLAAVPGIGFKLAGAIVRARAERGGFKTLDDLAGVPGVGKTLLTKIRPYVTL